jgi:hypothetical protein
MFETKKSASDVKTYLTTNKWELGELYPGPEGFYTKKTATPHLHFTMAAPNCYLHYKSSTGSVEINSWGDVSKVVPAGAMRIEAQGLMVFLTMS